jgi:hypothetical protein
MKDNMNQSYNIIHISLIYNLEWIKTIFNYIYTFGLTEGKNPSVAHEEIQDNVNNTGVMFIYL